MKIREDLEGIVIAYTDDGTVTLSAGDEVPDGVEVGDHLLADETAQSEHTDETPKPRRRASTK